MAKKRRHSLHPIQRQSPDSLPPEEIAARRAQHGARRSAKREDKGHQLLVEGTRLLNDGQAGEAAPLLEEAARFLPDNPDVAINLGGAYILLRRHNKAVAVLEAASQRHPDHAMVWVNLAAAYLGTLEIAGPQQQAEAIAAFGHALAIDPNVPHVHYNLGLIHRDRGELEQARWHFQRALETNPADRDAQRWLTLLEQADLPPRLE